MNAYTATATMPGRAAGITTRNGAPSGPLPSTRAASSRSRGIQSKYPVEHPDGERQRERQVGQDQATESAVERDARAVADAHEDQEERQQEQDSGEHSESVALGAAIMPVSHFLDPGGLRPLPCVPLISARLAG
jgi:hypothetical protein